MSVGKCQSVVYKLSMFANFVQLSSKKNVTCLMTSFSVAKLLNALAVERVVNQHCITSKYLHISFTLSQAAAAISAKWNLACFLQLPLFLLSSFPSLFLSFSSCQCCPTAAKIFAQVWTLGMPEEGKHAACRMGQFEWGTRWTILLDVDGAEYAAASVEA